MAKSSDPRPRAAVQPYSAQLPVALLNAFETNNRINLYLIENLPTEAWKAKASDGKGRTIAAIVAHMHNVRLMWLKAAKADEIPDQLDRATVTPKQVTDALEGQLQSVAHTNCSDFRKGGPH